MSAADSPVGGPREGVFAGSFSDVGPQVAGMLAEAGVRVLLWHEPGETPRRLEARQTDLPGLLRDAPIGTRATDERGWIVLDVEPNQIRWRIGR